MKKAAKKVTKSVKNQQEAKARFKMLEEIFNDFNSNRVQVYKLNFMRGIMFGFGSVVGGTVVIALVIWLLAFLGNFIEPLGGVFDSLRHQLETVD